MRIVISPAVDADRLSALRQAAPDVEFINAETLDQAAAAIAEAEGFLGKITPDLLAQARRLRWVQAFTASLEHYVFPDLVAHSCQLCNTRGLFGDVIADQVMGYVLCFARNLHTYIRRQIEHRYEPVGSESGRVSNASGPGQINAIDRGTLHLPDCRMGIVGFGAIGQEIANRALSFGMTVRGVDPHSDQKTKPEGVDAIWGMDRLHELLEWSDFVVIAAPHTPETERLFKSDLIARMKPTAYLINIGRGAIVVLDDLVAALRHGQLAGAALDVFEIEPLPSDHPLWDFPNVILTPHTAGYSTKVAGRHLATLTENTRRFAAGEPLLNVVNKALWY